MSTKVSAIPAASAATGTEAFPVVQGGASRKMTLAQVLTYIRTADFSALGDYADDTAAAAGGVAVGRLYRNGSVVMVRVA